MPPLLEGSAKWRSMNSRAKAWWGPFYLYSDKVLVRDPFPVGVISQLSLFSATNNLFRKTKKYNFVSFNLFSLSPQAIVMFAIIFSSVWRGKAILSLGFGEERKLLWEALPLIFPVSHLSLLPNTVPRNYLAKHLSC